MEFGILLVLLLALSLWAAFKVYDIRERRRAHIRSDVVGAAAVLVGVLLGVATYIRRR